MTLAEDLVKMISAEVSLDSTVQITVETDLLLTGLVDSLGVVEVVAWLEDRLGVEIDPIDVVLENFQTVGRMVSYADRRASEDSE